jgi:hypothetical protein
LKVKGKRMRTGIKIMILEQLVDEEVFVYHDKFYAKVPPLLLPDYIPIIMTLSLL